jgi:apolipoprotein D and lipocalin family protein
MRQSNWRTGDNPARRPSGATVSADHLKKPASQGRMSRGCDGRPHAWKACSRQRKAVGFRAMEMAKQMKQMLILSLISLLGCVRIPDPVMPVENFKADRYLGKWYEIARLDHSFERGLTRVTADYSLRGDGGIRVLNRGYSVHTGTWKETEGKAYFVGRSDRGFLKVSFFGPFYGSYIVFALDHANYQYSLVCGPDKSYLWVLSRSPTLNEELKKTLINKAATLGFDTNRLIFVDQD